MFLVETAIHLPPLVGILDRTLAATLPALTRASGEVLRRRQGVVLEIVAAAARVWECRPLVRVMRGLVCWALVTQECRWQGSMINV